MCVIPNAMPYSEIKNDKYIGFVADYMALIENKIKKPIKVVETSSWKESLDFIRTGKCDLLPSAVWNKQRDDEFSFTKPYLNIPFVLMTKSSNSFIDNL